MKLLVVALFVFCLFKDINTQCCRRLPSVYNHRSCACADTSGVLHCNTCNSYALCNCGGCSNCFIDTSNTCKGCEEKLSPVCSCLKALKKDCGCEKAKSFVYFPEVEYPMTTIEMNPFYFTNCWTY